MSTKSQPSTLTRARRDAMMRAVRFRTKISIQDLESRFEEVEPEVLKMAETHGFLQLTADQLHYWVDDRVWRGYSKATPATLATRITADHSATVPDAAEEFTLRFPKPSSNGPCCPEYEPYRARAERMWVKMRLESAARRLKEIRERLEQMQQKVEETQEQLTEGGQRMARLHCYIRTWKLEAENRRVAGRS